MKYIISKITKRFHDSEMLLNCIHFHFNRIYNNNDKYKIQVEME